MKNLQAKNILYFQPEEKKKSFFLSPSFSLVIEGNKITKLEISFDVEYRNHQPCCIIIRGDEKKFSKKKDIIVFITKFIHQTRYGIRELKRGKVAFSVSEIALESIERINGVLNTDKRTNSFNLTQFLR